MKRDDFQPTRYEHLSVSESELYDFAKPFTESGDRIVKTLADGVISLLEKKVSASRLAHSRERY